MKYLVVFVLLSWSSWAPLAAGDDHDIHISLSEVRWNQQSASFEVSLKIFIDDLELALGKKGESNLHIGSSTEAATADGLIETYLVQHFRISINGVTLPASYIGKEVAADFQAIWCYIEFPGVKDPKTCSIANDVLFELYDDQRNIMDIRMSPSHKTYIIFEPQKSAWSYTF